MSRHCCSFFYGEWKSSAREASPARNRKLPAAPICVPSKSDPRKSKAQERPSSPGAVNTKIHAYLKRNFAVRNSGLFRALPSPFAGLGRRRRWRAFAFYLLLFFVLL